MRLFSSLTTAHYRLLAAVWTIGIVVAVTVPVGKFPEVDAGFGLDKVVHALLFAGFGVLWLRAVSPSASGPGACPSHWRGLAVFAVGVLFAIATELYQDVALPRRTGGIYDATADLAGLLIAFGGYYAMQQYRASRSSEARGEGAGGFERG